MTRSTKAIAELQLCRRCGKPARYEVSVRLLGDARRERLYACGLCVRMKTTIYPRPGKV